jgi:hypothetical protein
MGSVKLYGKRFMKLRSRQEADSRRETRDGIVWDVLPNDRVCRVKVQGSTEFVIAWYPENMQTKPGWMKPGNAVRIAHVGGAGGRIEVVGHGLRLPSAISGAAFPPEISGPDGAVSGLYVHTGSTPSMTAWIEPGTFRINGVTYELTGDQMTMQAASSVAMGSDPLMGGTAATVTLNAAPAVGSFRYDLIVVGTDGVVDYIAGTPWAYPGWALWDKSSTPVKPTLPAGHVMLGDYILVYGGMTEVTNADIGREWTRPQVAELRVVADDETLLWGGLVDGYPPGTLADLQTLATATVYDQYWQVYGEVAPWGFTEIGFRVAYGYGYVFNNWGTFFGPGTEWGGDRPWITLYGGNWGQSFRVGFVRPYVWVDQPIVEDPGYPGYYEADSGHSALLEVRCVAAESTYYAYVLIRHFGNDNLTFMPPEI